MAFFAVSLAYMLRISLSYAITQMVLRPNTHSNGTVTAHPDVCPAFADEIGTNGSTIVADVCILFYTFILTYNKLIKNSYFHISLPVRCNRTLRLVAATSGPNIIIILLGLYCDTCARRFVVGENRRQTYHFIGRFYCHILHINHADFDSNG